MMQTAKSLIIAVAALLCVTITSYATDNVSSINASDSRVTFIGRTQTKEGSVSFDWTGVYCKVKFQGKNLSIKVSDTKKNYYNVWLDAGMNTKPNKIIAVHGNDSTIVVFSEEELKALFGKDKKAAKEAHQVTLQKRTEGEQGTTTIHSFMTDGEFVQADKAKNRVIEFIGDSYTCGFGSENSVATDPFTPETENQNNAYACVVARYFDADQIIVAHSGMGVARNYNSSGNGYCMPERYLHTYDMQKDVNWNPEDCQAKPNLTVIYLGTNDFSKGLQPAERLFKQGYIKLIKEIKAFYGKEHPILCVAPRNDIVMFDYIRAACTECQFDNVYSMAFTNRIHNDAGDMGACWHPNQIGHVKKAYSMIPYISTITGWEMNMDVIR